MEEKKKSNVGFIVLIVVLILVICGLVGYILYDKTSDDIKSQKGKTVETEKKEEKDASKYKDELALLSEKIFVEEKDTLSVDELNGAEFITVLVSISGKSFTDVTGTELKQIAKDNFGVKELDLADIKCGMKHPAGETNVMLIFNPESDKYEFNPNHPGHGGGAKGVSFYFGDGKATVDGDYYTYKANVYFYKTCSGDTCGPIENMDIYATYNDFEQDTNRIMDATTNEKYCKQVDVGYECNNDDIYNAIKDKLHSVTFYYKLVNNKPVFVRYEFK